ncbi:hypothetical protein ASPZODRAFT_156482 [Penicilliopsis zonata CBS 506.65]|uniref:Uncharacterized protein n=1 Tax=Penicilliopsis zonata CBS 506.65 TaxID=1073090 RepID=A0A1L9SWY2_9EURO|nr:hypothetical protein ASPZODRAFT_156482 [Penicilliopsis zonata CBS 506.65]OJJ51637.1 hypothetical protein ASPZODRAFT_156482 [Penicilliopsis zonata CBS 506.65]
MEDIRPTARWANRMLRPLASIYRRLEKHQEIVSIIGANTKYKGKLDARNVTPAAVSNGAQVGDEGPDLEGGDHDPAWVPGRQVKRRIRHKYTTRGEGKGERRKNRVCMRSPEVNRTLPGAIEIATPLIMGKSMRAVAPTSLQNRKSLFAPPSTVPAASSGDLSEGPKPLRRKKDPSLFKYQGTWKEVLDKSGDTGLIDIARFLNRIFLKFLTNTRVSNGPLQHNQGTRTLLSMAVRRLPEFIAEEQRLQEEEEDMDEDIDMCDAYFTELETHYAPSGNGWQPLREAVRAQGIHLVAEMLKQKWLTRPVACRLLEECMHQAEYDAFETLLSGYLATVESYDYPTALNSPRLTDQCTDPVQLLNAYYFESSRSLSYVFAELAKLLLRRAIPPEWMITTLWKKCVDDAVVSLSTDDGDSAAAAHLIEAVIVAASCSFPAIDGSLDMANMSYPVGRQRGTRASAASEAASLAKRVPCPIPVQDALSNLTVSLVTVLCGMCMVRSRRSLAADQKDINAKMKSIVGSLVLMVQRSIKASSVDPKAGNPPTSQSLRCGCILLGYCLLLFDGWVSSEGGLEPIYLRPLQMMESFFSSLAAQQKTVKELAVLVRQVFYCYERATKGEEGTSVSRMMRTRISQLLEMKGIRGVSEFLAKVAVEAAMDYAESTLETEDHVWALEVQEKVASSQTLQKGGGSGDDNETRHVTAAAMDLYRWEESIEEWVAKTPAVPRPKKTLLPLRTTSVTRKTSAVVIACSTDSSASALESRSSVTSSPPPSIKRHPSRKEGRDEEEEDLEWRPRKRLRAFRVAAATERRAVPEPSSFTTTTVTKHRRSERAALREMRHAANLTDPGLSRRRQPSSKVEVVIINHKHQQGPAAAQGESCRPVPANMDQCIPSHCSMQARHVSRVSSSDQGCRTRTLSTPITRRKAVIPCSQDESDDELSFL